MRLRGAAAAVGIWMAFASVATADVKIESVQRGEGMARIADGPATVWLKGLKMRSESSAGDGQVMILDAEAREMIVLYPKKKKAEVYDLTRLSNEMLAVSTDDVRVSVTEAEGNRTLAGYDCRNHEMQVEIDMTGPDGSPLTTILSGPVCLSDEAPGIEDVQRFYAAAAESGLFFMPPQAAEAQKGQAKGFAELYRAMTDKGVALSTELQIGFQGSGMMAAMFEKMTFKTVNEVQSIDTASLPDDLFEIPSGYKVDQK